MADTTHTIATAFNPPGLPTAGSLLHTVWKFYREHFRSLLKTSILALIAFPLTLPGMMLTATGISPAGTVEYSPTSFKDPISLIFVALGSFAAVLVTTYVRATLIDKVDGILSHRAEPHLRLSKTLPVYLQYFAVVILTGLAASLGFAFLFIPGVLAIIYFLFAEPIVILEKAHALDAVKRSVKMVHGRFVATAWRAAAVDGVFALASSAFAILTVQLPLTALRASTWYDPTKTKIFVQAAPFLLLAWLISAVTLPLFLSFQVILYRETKKIAS